MKLYPGMKLQIAPTIYQNPIGGTETKRSCTGKVVYINRRHKYFTVRFDFPGGSFRESFKGV